MHQPPAWALDESERLTLEGFLESFGAAWERTERRFLKLECWQSYREADGVRSQEAFQAGDTALARRLLEEEAMGDQPLRDDVRRGTWSSPGFGCSPTRSPTTCATK
ncbi:hypothetical protein [Actinomadura livida]|nr:hypothetical protein [Actinomadura livida]GGU26212.1 hypothetical protein GCM10010208_58680 [Actinomadura livida]